jgi:hypothetical protein
MESREGLVGERHLADWVAGDVNGEGHLPERFWGPAVQENREIDSWHFETLTKSTSSE